MSRLRRFSRSPVSRTLTSQMGFVLYATSKAYSQVNAKTVTLVKFQIVTASPAQLAYQASLCKVAQFVKIVLIQEKFQILRKLAVYNVR